MILYIAIDFHRANAEHADGINEEDESELLDESEYLGIDAHAEMAEGDAHKKDPGYAQRDAADLDLAQQSTQGDGGGEDEYDMGSATAEKQFFKHKDRDFEKIGAKITIFAQR